MDYTRNEDYYGRFNQSEGATFNNVTDVLFVEDSSPPTEPVTLAEAKEQAIIDDNVNDDGLIEAYITVARMQCESFVGMSLIPRTIIAQLNNSLGGIYLPYGPINEVESIYDQDDNEIESANYKILGVQFKQIDYPRYKYLKVTYTAGFSTLPHLFKTAILQQVAYLYEHRGDEKNDTLSPIVQSLLKPQMRK